MTTGWILRRFCLAIAITAGMAAALAACARQTPADNDLVLWHAYRGQEKAALEKALGLYNERLPAGAPRVRALAIPFDAYSDKISAATPRGNGPDLFISAHDRIGGWVEAGRTLEPIEYYLDDALTSQFLPNMIEPLTYRGVVYGLPLNFKSVAMIYNTRLVATPPRTTAELIASAQALTDPQRGEYGLAYFYAEAFYHAALLNGFGGGIFDENDAPRLNSSGNVASLETLLKWKNEAGVLPPDPSTALITSLFNSGKTAIVFSGPWFLAELDPSLPVAVAPLPTIDEAGGRPMSPWLQVDGIYVTAGGANIEAAYDVAAFLVGAEAGRILTIEGGQLHANKAVYDDPVVAVNPIVTAFRTQLETATPMPNIAEMTIVWSPLRLALRKTVKEASSPRAALDEAQASIEANIAAYRKSR